ncbi:glycosyltransferase family 2 protein [Macrococcus lamae]|uniref:4,4'-diaponeurosporenoate glycosyltransferase n=1 Tax=Macrococcus lamae TaxID=198484 RepID=A0A4R6BWE4_9STAP|nr:glycosyltransferase family 2 protein [Macrococcus lamae]TDM12747.1 glycosyltransferase family 2 protein [Macrococcus lamae]
MLIVFVILTLLSLVCGYLMYMRHPVVEEVNTQLQQSVSVIIPARDEEDNLPTLLQSIQMQTMRPLDVIIVDDGSTDNTAVIAEQFGAHVIHFDNQSDWKGKTAACYDGARYARGNILIFMDADTWFNDKSSLAKITATYKEGLLAIQPYHVTKMWYEQLSVLFNILTITGMNIFSVIRPKQNTGAFGPFILCSREDYIKTGGHKEASGEIIEGFALAHNFHQHQLSVTLLLGQGTLNFRMYPRGLRFMMSGWAKHFATGATETLPAVMTLIVLWMTASVTLPLFIIWGLVTGPGHLITAIFSYLIYSSYFYVISRRTGNFNILTALLFPMTFLFFMYVFMRSAFDTYIRKEVKWKGRHIKF